MIGDDTVCYLKRMTIFNKGRDLGIFLTGISHATNCMLLPLSIELVHFRSENLYVTYYIIWYEHNIRVR